METFEDFWKFFIIDTTVWQKDSVNKLVIEELTGASQASTMTLAKRVFLKHKRLFLDFVQNGQRKI